MSAWTRWILAWGLVLVASNGTAATPPLDLADPTLRPIVVEFETSSNLSTVGAAYGESVSATYSAASGVGTVVIAGDDFEDLFTTPGFVIESSDIVIEITLATGDAAVASASGTVSFSGAGYTWFWSLDTIRTGGWIEHSLLPPLFCDSQAYIDDVICPSLPQFCDAVCNLVPAAPYSPVTGMLNMVGFERQDGCGETGCLILDFFTGRGDIRLSEVEAPIPLPATSGPVLVTAGMLALVLYLAWLRKPPGRTDTRH